MIKAVEILMVKVIEGIILHSSTSLDELKQHESSKEKPSLDAISEIKSVLNLQMI